jgi:hypothetical protein
LGVGKKRVENAKVGMSELKFQPMSEHALKPEQKSKEKNTDPFGLLGEISKLADKDVDQDTEVVGIKVLVCSRCREEKIEDLENQQGDAKIVLGAACL